MGYPSKKVSSPHAMLEIARKRIPGIEPVNLFGFDPDSGTDWAVIWGNGTFSFPSSALVMTLVSSSESDTMSVLVQGLDANYNVISDVVELNGITPVTTSIPFFRINTCIILSGSNVGDISITNSESTHAYILAGSGVSQACVYSVPAGHALYLFRIDANSGTATGQQYLRIRNVVRTYGGRILRTAQSSFTNVISYDRQIPFRIAEKSDFWFESQSSASTNEISIFVEALLMENNNA